MVLDGKLSVDLTLVVSDKFEYSNWQNLTMPTWSCHMWIKCSAKICPVAPRCLPNCTILSPVNLFLEATAFLMSVSSASSSGDIGHDFLRYDAITIPGYNFWDGIDAWSQSADTSSPWIFIEIDSTISKNQHSNFFKYAILAQLPKISRKHLPSEWPGGPRSHTSPANASQCSKWMFFLHIHHTEKKWENNEIPDEKWQIN